MAETNQTLPQTIPEKIAVAMQLKEDGNNLFRQGDFKKAISRYIKIFLYMNGLNGNQVTDSMKSMLGRTADSSTTVSKEDSSQIIQLQLTANLNLSACYLKTSEYQRAFDYATKALTIAPKNSKALFRRGQACNFLNRFDDALVDLNASMEIERTESTRLEINISKKKLREYMEKQRGAYAGMFEKLTKSDVTP